MTGRTVGIDLGTTNSVVAVLENGEPVVIPLAEGGRLCPSVVGFSRNGERLVGSLAKRQAITAPDRSVASIKRHMGDANYRVSIDGTDYSPPEISAMVLQKLKADAEAYLGQTVTAAVITVPAYFNDAQRQATKDAGRIAGLDVLRIINEPTAAALAYGLDKQEPHTLLVWDLGGGTFDVSILTIGGDGVFTVLATAGDTRLGGDDWDERVIDDLMDTFQQQTSVDLRHDKIAMQRLKDAGEKAKIELSTLNTTQVNLPFLSATGSGPAHLDVEITRARLEQLTLDLRERMLGPTRQALTDAGLLPSHIDRIVLVGGSTRMPAVQDMVRDLFGREPFRGTNPDETVALGAALQAGILTGERKNLVLVDVTPLSIGLETVGGLTTRLISRNTSIPTSRTEIFTTAQDNQSAVDIRIVQGERDMASDNRFLGRFVLAGIPPAPRGRPKIAVTFDIDANGIVHVAARDSSSGRIQRVTVKASGGLSKEEIDGMVVEAAAHAEIDRARREKQESVNAADTLIYGAFRTVRDAQKQDGVDTALIKATRESINALRQTLSEEDATVADIKKRMDLATDALYALSHELFRNETSLLIDVQEESEQSEGFTTEDPRARDNGQDAVTENHVPARVR